MVSSLRHRRWQQWRLNAGQRHSVTFRLALEDGRRLPPPPLTNQAFPPISPCPDGWRFWGRREFYLASAVRKPWRGMQPKMVFQKKENGKVALRDMLNKSDLFYFLKSRVILFYRNNFPRDWVSILWSEAMFGNNCFVINVKCWINVLLNF